MRMKAWLRLPQEREGKHQFAGAFYVTQGASSKLSPAEIIAIYLDISKFVTENGGADYFQVYENEMGEKLYFIDQGPSGNVLNVKLLEHENYCVLMCSDEY